MMFVYTVLMLGKVNSVEVKCLYLNSLSKSNNEN